jgi:hypothetical protein
MEAQSRNAFTPFVDKQCNQYVADINSGVYSNSGLTLVQFDLSQIYNSSRWTSTQDMFLTIPIQMVAAFSTGAALVAPSTCASYSLLSLKNGYHHLIHSADLVIDGKTVSDSQPFLNINTHVKMLSEMSYTDLLTSGTALGMSDELDSPYSQVWNTVGAASKSGDGLTNNCMLGPASSLGTVGSVQTALTVAQGGKVMNTSGCKRIARSYDITAGHTQNLTGLVSASKMVQDFRPTFTEAGSYMIWNDVAIIRLRDLFDSMDKIGLVKKLNCQLRLYVNTGACSIGVSDPNATTTGYATFSPSNSTFGATCPFTINYLADLVANGGIPATTTNIVAGCFIQRPATTALAGVNLALSNASHAMPSCRIYYSSIQLDPAKELKYIESSSAKSVVYKNYICNQYSAITAGGNFSQIIQSGITNAYALLIVPLIATTAQNNHTQYGSPYDTSPATFSPLQVSNLSVQLGGVQVYQQAYQYSFEHFLTQINNNESPVAGDFGLGTGLVSRAWWENNRFIWVNLTRSAPADRVVPRSIYLSFTNNSDVAMDLLVFTIYLDEFTLDVSKGSITK